MRIDAHQHFWDPARVEYGWMGALAGEVARRLVRPVLPVELDPMLALATQAPGSRGLKRIFGGTAAKFYRLLPTTPTAEASLSHAL